MKLSRTNPALPARKAAIRTAGLYPPAVMVAEDRVGATIPRDDWSKLATDALRQAFIDEMAADRWPLVILDESDAELNDIADLHSAVALTIARNASPDTRKHSIPPPEIFPDKVRLFDYSVGPAEAIMARHQVDAVWFVSCGNLLRTTGQRVMNGFGAFFGVLGVLGGGPGPTHWMRLQVQATLVDKSGAVLYYCALNELNVPHTGREPGQPDDDLRDPRTARMYVRAILDEYRQAVQP